MKAHIGDRLVVQAGHPGQPPRVGIITALPRRDGNPPYVVCWLDTGREVLVFPGTGARLLQSGATRRSRRRGARP